MLTLPAASGFSAPAGATYRELSLANFSTCGNSYDQVVNHEGEVAHQFLFPLGWASSLLLLLAGGGLRLLCVGSHLGFLTQLKSLKLLRWFTLLTISCSAMIRCTSLSKLGIGPKAAVDSF